MQCEVCERLKSRENVALLETLLGLRRIRGSKLYDEGREEGSDRLESDDHTCRHRVDM